MSGHFGYVLCCLFSLVIIQIQALFNKGKIIIQTSVFLSPYANIKNELPQYYHRTARLLSYLSAFVKPSEADGCCESLCTVAIFGH